MMADLLVGGSSAAEAMFVKTIRGDDVAYLLARRPLQFMAYALAQGEEPPGVGIAEMIGTSIHDRWLPDFLIMMGYRELFFSSRRPGRLEAASAMFLSSIRVGIPYFARSLRLLDEGLTILADVDPEAKRARDLVWRLSMRAYPEETFTTVRLDI